MHLNLHKKAYKKVLLIANGYEPYHDDISHLAESVQYIDPYSQDKNYIKSLETFKNKHFRNSVGQNQRETKNEIGMKSSYISYLTS